MRALLLLSPLLLFSGCVDDPCAGQGADRLQVWPLDRAAMVSPGDPRAFLSIAEAIEAADEGASICVAPGLYRETLRVDKDGLKLLGAGSGATVVEAPTRAQDPRESVDTTALLTGLDIELAGMTLSGGARGLVLDRDAEVQLRDLILRDNGAGLLATGPASLVMEDVHILSNPAIGAWIGGGDGTVSIQGGQIAGNGTLGSSEVGGLYSELPVQAQDLELRDNAGTRAADLMAIRGLDLRRSTVQRPSTVSEAPRILTTGDTTLLDTTLNANGAPVLHARCAGGSLHLSNITLVDAQGQTEAVTARDCVGEVVHVTLLGLALAEDVSALRLVGEGELTVVNTAAVGYAQLLEQDHYEGLAIAHHNFIGSASEAALLRAMEVNPDLRTQSDSPLVDSGADMGPDEDPDGRPRPNGRAPDIGAYEHY